jgi:AraC-like DNA-binding protein
LGITEDRRRATSNACDPATALEDLLHMFEKTRGETLADDKLLLAAHDPVVARAVADARLARHALTLEVLAAQTATSPSVLSERFTRFVGQAPMQYLARWRMQSAARLLLESATSKVAMVAEAVGYDSEAAFSRAFKKCVGVSPAAWREEKA